MIETKQEVVAQPHPSENPFYLKWMGLAEDQPDKDAQHLKWMLEKAEKDEWWAQQYERELDEYHHKYCSTYDAFLNGKWNSLDEYQMAEVKEKKYPLIEEFIKNKHYVDFLDRERWNEFDFTTEPHPIYGDNRCHGESKYFSLEETFQLVEGMKDFMYRLKSNKKNVPGDWVRSRRVPRKLPPLYVECNTRPIRMYIIDAFAYYKAGYVRPYKFEEGGYLITPEPGEFMILVYGDGGMCDFAVSFTSFITHHMPLKFINGVEV